MFSSLPLVAESQFAQFISGQFDGGYQKTTPSGVVSGSYGVTRAFTVAECQYPLVTVKAGRFREIEPGTNVFEGTLSIGIISQIDDDNLDVIETHDSKVTQLYNIMDNAPLVLSGVAGPNFTLLPRGYYITNYDQELAPHGEGRELLTVIEYSINCANVSF